MCLLTWVGSGGHWGKHTERSTEVAALRWRHNDHAGVSNHQPHGCLLNSSFRRKSKKTSKLRVTGFVREIHRGPVNFPHKWPVTRKCFHLMTSSWVSIVTLTNAWLFWYWGRDIPGELGHHQGCWCHGSLRRHAISSHGIQCRINGTVVFHDARFRPVLSQSRVIGEYSNISLKVFTDDTQQVNGLWCYGPTPQGPWGLQRTALPATGPRHLGTTMPNTRSGRPAINSPMHKI